MATSKGISLVAPNSTLSLTAKLKAKHVRQSYAPPPDEMEKIINGLTNLEIDKRPVLGDRKNIEKAIRNAKQAAKKPDSDKVIVISDSESEEEKDRSIPPPFLTPKAHKLNKLVKKTGQATDSRALSALVKEFISVLQSNSSRTLTKEASAFLDALHKQLADPSVFVTPLR